MALLRIRKPNGEIVEIAALPGAKGDAPPPATVHTYGTVKVVPKGAGTGVYMNDGGRLQLEYATEYDIKLAVENAAFIPRPIDPLTLVEYVGSKIAPATVHTYGTVKVVPKGAGTGVYMNDGGRLQLEYATEDDIKLADEQAANVPRPINPIRLVEYVGSKIAPATNGTIGTIKITEDYRASGLQISDHDGCLRVVPATEEQIDQRIFAYLPITPKNLDYAVKSVTYDKAEIDAKIGDIEAALDSILAMQNALIGGDGV